MARASLAGAVICSIGLSFALAGCGPRSAANTTAGTGERSQRLSSATLTFKTLQDGKDAKSAVVAQLVRNGNELGAEASSSGTEFDDNTIATPIAMTVRGPFERQDARNGQLRLRLTPDGDDTWTFDVGLTLRYADESQQTFSWQSVRLDEKAPERTLVLAGAETP